MSLTSVAMQNPVMVKLQEEVNDAARLQQYYLQCRDADKFLLVFALLKLGSIRGKVCETVLLRIDCLCVCVGTDREGAPYSCPVLLLLSHLNTGVCAQWQRLTHSS